MTERKYNMSDIPSGYIPGVNRCSHGDYMVTHLYKGTFDDPGLPMCIDGWNRDDHESYSIFRNNISSKGICNVCLKRALQGLDGITKEEVQK